jgi:GTP 3',8-cyclase
MLKPCLFATPEIDLKGPLRQGADDQILAALFQEAMRLKGRGLKSTLGQTQPGRAMVSIGG